MEGRPSTPTGGERTTIAVLHTRSFGSSPTLRPPRPPPSSSRCSTARASSRGASGAYGSCRPARGLAPQKSVSSHAHATAAPGAHHAHWRAKQPTTTHNSLAVFGCSGSLTVDAQRITGPAHALGSRGTTPRLAHLALRRREGRSHPVDQAMWGRGPAALRPRGHRRVDRRGPRSMDARLSSETRLAVGARSGRRWAPAPRVAAVLPAAMRFVRARDRFLGRLCSFGEHRAL